MTLDIRCPSCGNKLWRQKRCDTESCNRYQDEITDPDVKTDGIVTVGDLREELADLPDDALVTVTASGAWNFAYSVSQDTVTKANAERTVLSLSEWSESDWY